MLLLQGCLCNCAGVEVSKGHQCARPQGSPGREQAGGSWGPARGGAAHSKESRSLLWRRSGQVHSCSASRHQTSAAPEAKPDSSGQGFAKMAQPAAGDLLHHGPSNLLSQSSASHMPEGCEVFRAQDSFWTPLQNPSITPILFLMSHTTGMLHARSGNDQRRAQGQPCISYTGCNLHM